MNFVYDIIDKRDGKELSKEQIERFVKGVTDQSIPDYQISAMLMAICINGLSIKETAELTYAMTHSGKVLDLSSVKGIKVDKHSTGGVADTTTLILAPLTASLGLPVIKMSGRGLGHTGGTLDKLESIPGFNINLKMAQAIEQVNKHNIVLMGQTNDLAPADKYLYALRDVTGTVENISLIASSIMSKKLAAGADAIVLDVKYGSGAFMKSADKAIQLAAAMKSIGKHMNKDIHALITNMDQPLGTHIGNSLEVIEAAEILKGNISGDLKKVSLELGAEMLIAGKLYDNKNDALKALNTNIENGKGLEKFAQLIELQGGNSKVLSDYSLLPQPNEELIFRAECNGFINKIDTTQIGRASVETGAGRKSKNDSLDYSAGIIMYKRLGDSVTTGEPIAAIYSSDEDKCCSALQIMKAAITIGEKPKIPKLIISEEV